MTNLNVILTLILAAYAIAHTITKERGPLAVFSRLRGYFAAKYPPAPQSPGDNAPQEAWEYYQQYLEDYSKEEEFFYRTLYGYGYALLSCPYCLGAYSAFFVVFISPAALTDWLAVYGGVIAILEMTKEKSSHAL